MTPTPRLTATASSTSKMGLSIPRKGWQIAQGRTMLSLYLTLSLRYLRRRWFYALTIVASIAAGVSLLVATRAINQTMNRAAQSAATPLAGTIDLIIGNGETTVDQKLAQEFNIPGVQSAKPHIFDSVVLPDHDNRTVLLVGIDVQSE